MHSPHTLRRGNDCFSISATDQPACASRIAAVGTGGTAAYDDRVEVRVPCSMAKTIYSRHSREGWNRSLLRAGAIPAFARMTSKNQRAGAHA